MIAEGIKNLLAASPFRPFTVYMASEKPFKIPHPDFALLSPRGKTLFVAHDHDDAADILDVALIARIEVHDTASSPS